MRNHTLMQTIARANRVFPDKKSPRLLAPLNLEREGPDPNQHAYRQLRLRDMTGPNPTAEDQALRSVASGWQANLGFSARLRPLDRGVAPSFGTLHGTRLHQMRQGRRNRPQAIRSASCVQRADDLGRRHRLARPPENLEDGIGPAHPSQVPTADPGRRSSDRGQFDLGSPERRSRPRQLDSPILESRLQPADRVCEAHDRRVTHK